MDVREVSSEEEMNSVLAADKVNIQIIDKAVNQKGSYTAKTRTHQRRRAAGQVCPFCRGPLECTRDQRGAMKKGTEYFTIRCHYRHSSDIECNFSVDITPDEYALFKDNVYPTKSWLVELTKLKCPKCNKPLYERKLLDGSIFHRCIGTLQTARAGYLRHGGCDFCNEIIDDRN